MIYYYATKIMLLFYMYKLFEKFFIFYFSAKKLSKSLQVLYECIIFVVSERERVR